MEEGYGGKLRCWPWTVSFQIETGKWRGVKRGHACKECDSYIVHGKMEDVCTAGLQGACEVYRVGPELDTTAVSQGGPILKTWLMNARYKLISPGACSNYQELSNIIYIYIYIYMYV